MVMVGGRQNRKLIVLREKRGDNEGAICEGKGVWLRSGTRKGRYLREKRGMDGWS